MQRVCPFDIKKALLLMSAFFVLSSVVSCLYARDMLGVDTHEPSGYSLFWGGRFLAGIACGLATAVVPTYLAEISPKRIRGAVGTSNQLQLCLGIIVANVLGYGRILGAHQYWWALFLPNAIPTFNFVAYFTILESPLWLVKVGRNDDAKRALQRLRMTDDVEMELKQMTVGVNQTAIQLETSNGDRTNDAETAEYNENSEQRRAAKWAMSIAVVLMVMQKFSGINAVFYYTTIILQDAGVTSELGIWLGTIAISAANFLGVFIAVALIDRAGRRVLLSISSIMIVISSVLVSVSIIMNESGSNIMWSYAALGGLVLFVVGFEVGIGPCVWLLVGELPPMRYRGVIVSVAVGFNWLSHLAIAQWSPIILESDFKMFPFAIATFLALIFIHRFLPETNGKTAKEIQKALNNL